MYLKRYNKCIYKNASKVILLSQLFWLKPIKRPSMKMGESIKKFKFLFMDVQNITNNPEVNYWQSFEINLIKACGAQQVCKINSNEHLLKHFIGKLIKNRLKHPWN